MQQPLSSGTACSFKGHYRQSRQCQAASSLCAARHGSHVRSNPVQGAYHALLGHANLVGPHRRRKAWLDCTGLAWLPGTCSQTRLGSQQVSHLRLGPTRTGGTTENRWRRSPQTGAWAGCLIRLQHQSCRFLSSAAEQLTERRGRGVLGGRACVVACRQGQPISCRVHWDLHPPACTHCRRASQSDHSMTGCWMRAATFLIWRARCLWGGQRQQLLLLTNQALANAVKVLVQVLADGVKLPARLIDHLHIKKGA